MKQQTCKFVLEDGSTCASIYHTAMFHKPKKPIKQTAIKKKDFLSAPSKTKTLEFGGIKSGIKGDKKPRKKKTPRQKAKDEAWEAFSTYIRIRDCIHTTGTTDNCICVTCNERGDSSWKEYKHIQAGHAVGGRGNAVLFHEEIVNGQCDYCNSKPPYGLGGDYGNYAIFLVKKYGLEHAEYLQRLKGTEKIYKTHDFIEIRAKYEQKTKRLLETV